MSFWRTAVKVAWKDLQGSRAKSVFIVVAIAVSVAAVTGVRGASGEARQAIYGDTRAWLGADVCTDTTESVSESQAAALNALNAAGIRSTLVTRFLTMAASDASPDPGLIFVKVIDPEVYPYYGGLALYPARPLPELLRPDTALVSEQVRDRLRVQQGDAIQIGGRTFRISAIIGAEPQRFAGVLGLGMRCMLSREGYERSGLGRAATQLTHRVLLKLPESVSIEAARRRLEDIVPGGNIIDHREANRQDALKAELAITFLSVTAFLTLVLGTASVAIALRQHLEQRMNTMAVMRVLGARSPQITSVFLIQVAWLIGVGTVAGVLVGLALRALLLTIANRYLFLSSPSAAHHYGIFAGVAAGLLAALPAVVEPWLAIRHVRPGIVLRRSVESWTAGLPRVSRLSLYWTAGALTTAALGAIAAGMLGSRIAALSILGALGIAFAVAWSVAGLLLLVARRITVSVRGHRVRWISHGLLNLLRDGNGTRTLIAGVALGLMVVVGTLETEGIVARSVIATLPYSDAGFFIAGFGESHREQLLAFLKTQPGVERVEVSMHAAASIARVDGTPIREIQARTPVGSWYNIQCETGASGGITIGDDLARALKVHAGSEIEFRTHGAVVRERVQTIRVLSSRERFWYSFSGSCDGIGQQDRFYEATVWTRSNRTDEVRKAINNRFPALAVVSPDELLQTIRGISRDAVLLIRVVAWFACVSVVAMLAATVAASRGQRLREIGIYSALGAAPRYIRKMYSVEFAMTGLLAAVTGMLLASGLTTVLLAILFHRVQFVFGWRAAAGGLFATPFVTLLAGWLPAYGLVERKPMEALRRE